MKKNTFYLVAILIVVITFFVFCILRTRPVIPISNTLQINLDEKYDKYVSSLNKAADKDTAALHDILKTEVYDGAVLDNHGWILIQLLKRNGDDIFYDALQKLDSIQFENVRSYIGAGTDYDTGAERSIRNYPKTSKLLGR